jgi:hypothetical protein
MSSNKLTSPRFVLKGFSQQERFRLFSFEGIGADQVRKLFTVHADLTLIRGYGIHLQDLPLLCRGLLERRTESDAVSRLIFTEEDMRLFCADRLVAKQTAAQKRKPRPQIHAAVAAN